MTELNIEKEHEGFQWERDRENEIERERDASFAG